MRCVSISGSDDRMDCRDGFDDPINPLPPKCAACGFPDLEHLPQPYFLVKSRTMSPNELALADNGNFFVRERLRRVLDLLAPGQCDFFPTCFKGTTEKTPWLLAVPKHQVVTGRVDPSISRCQSCGEPRAAHPGTQWSEMFFGAPQREQPLGEGWTDESDFDVVKSATWGSSERGWDLWMCRDFYLSVRLLHLLKKIKAKGFYGTIPASPSKLEAAWIKEKIAFLEANGVPLHAAGTLSEDDARWFRQFLDKHAREAKSEWDKKSIEKRVKAKLPKSYVEFIDTVGPMSFRDVDEQEGFTASILPPTELGVEGHEVEFHDEESKAVNSLTFATTEHGDCFCFDVQKGKKEYAVFLFKHEMNLLEPYAESFAACIKRFAGGNDVY
jgi:hypothetical protein